MVRLRPDADPDDREAREMIRARLIALRGGRARTAVARRMGVHRSTVHTLEHRTGVSEIRTVQCWARALDHRLVVTLAGLPAATWPDEVAAVLAGMDARDPVKADSIALHLLVRNIQRIRCQVELTMADLASRLGVTTNAIDKVLADPDGLMVSTAQRYARGLGGWLHLDLEPLP